jgi:hypothetical protein
MTITFLLEHQKKDGDRYTLYGDFATLRGAEVFNQVVPKLSDHNNQELPTGFRIDGIKPGRRLFEDKYYELDVDGALVTRTGNTSFESYIIDYSSYRFEQGKRVIESAEKVDLDKAVSRIPPGWLRSAFCAIPDPDEGDMEFVRVNKVGQGNWNDYHIGKQIPLVFDLGTNMNAPGESIRNLVDEILPDYKQSNQKPILIISHWDLDHYKCLLYLKPDEIDVFDCFVLMETLPTATAKKAYDLIAKNPLARIQAITNSSSGKLDSDMVDLYYAGKKVSLYQGLGDNLNNSGLIAVVNNNNTIVTLSGDCAWYQLNHLNSKESSIKINRCYHLVVPHHGSGKDGSHKGFVLPNSWSCGESVISVGKNRYGHPAPSVVNYLKGLFGKSIRRTDINGSYNLSM